MSLGSIFLIDDNPSNLDLLAGILRERGYTVRMAPNGKLGLNAIKARIPDLVMLDVTMPEMDGYSVCEILKSDEKTRDIPVIFISALDETIDKVRAFEVGGVDYVTKPFRAEEVLARLETQLRISRLQKELQRTNAQLEEQRKQLLEANQKLLELDAVKAKFTAMLVHDLKSPLAVVKASLEMFELSKEVAQVLEEQQMLQLIEVSRRSIEKIFRLIQDVLEVFKSDLQDVQLEKQLINPLPMLREVLEEFRLAGARMNITVVDEIDPVLPMIKADCKQVERVLGNLLSNALKFTPTGGQIAIKAAVEENNNLVFLVIAISDTGVGIPASFLPFIFDPYRQVEGAGKKSSGVGLGLAIAKRIIEAHGGQITVESEPNVGSTFKVWLPVA
ncbi:MAG: hybrid sensor histidine kinase/response regulator [Acidobacteriota bacterium]|nr:hybrid sensor histidine kinase/response regulator [Blastocatellia bacterium]MDW8413340.1 hybrid sensor histidine kinase/response regulator [Acidobacteriota bacterium]